MKIEVKSKKCEKKGEKDIYSIVCETCLTLEELTKFFRLEEDITEMSEDEISEIFLDRLEELKYVWRNLKLAARPLSYISILDEGGVG